MSPRHHGITSLDEYAYWIDQTVHERGGVLDADYIQLDEVIDDEGRVVGHLYPRQWFQLPHGFAVGFDKFVDTDLTVVTYHYQYRSVERPDDPGAPQPSRPRCRRPVPHARTQGRRASDRSGP